MIPGVRIILFKTKEKNFQEKKVIICILKVMASRVKWLLILTVT